MGGFRQERAQSPGAGHVTGWAARRKRRAHGTVTLHANAATAEALEVARAVGGEQGLEQAHVRAPA